MTVSTVSADTPAAASAPLIAWAPRSIAEKLVSAPNRRPNGVREPPIITASRDDEVDKVTPHILCGAQHTSAITQNMRSHFRSEEHTSELQSRGQSVCRLLLEKTNR